MATPLRPSLWIEQKCCGRLLKGSSRGWFGQNYAYFSFRTAFWSHLSHSKVLGMAEQKDRRSWVLGACPGPPTAGISRHEKTNFDMLEILLFWVLYSMKPNLIVIWKPSYSTVCVPFRSSQSSKPCHLSFTLTIVPPQRPLFKVLTFSYVWL